MSGHDDKQLNDELAALREHVSSLPREAPDAAVDAAIRAAAEREVRRHYKPAWGAAAGLAACVALAVILVPALLVETPRKTAQPAATDLVLVAERYAEETEVRQKQRESMAMREAPAAVPPMPQATVEGKGTVSLAHEEWLAREEIAPAQPVGESRAILANSAKVLSQRAPARAQAAVPAPASIETLRTELADADEPAWRAQLLALREQGDENVAEQLLVDYRARFELPGTFTLDDLPPLNEEQINNE